MIPSNKRESDFNCFSQYGHSNKKLSRAYEQSIDRSVENISVAPLNRIINSVTCLNLSCPFDCQWCWESLKVLILLALTDGCCGSAWAGNRS